MITNLRIHSLRLNFLLISILLLTGCSQFFPEEIPETRVAFRNPTSTLETTTPSHTPTPAYLTGTISIWHSWNEQELPILENIIADFSETHPNVFFDVLYIPVENLLAKFEYEVGEGRGPTIILGPADWGPYLYDQGYIRSLSELISQALLTQINQPALEISTYNDELISLPYSLEGIILVRNRNIIPDSAATFEQLIFNAKNATQGEQIGAYLDRSFIYSGGNLEGIGGTLMDDSGSPAFNDQKGIEWLELLLSYQDAGPTDYNSDQDVDLFKAGRVGLIIEGSWRIPELSEAIGIENIVIDNWPEFNEGAMAGYVFPEMVFLTRDTTGDGLNASKAFLEHLISNQTQTRFAEQGKIPSNTSIILTDPITGTLMMKSMNALSKGIGFPVNPEMDAYLTPMDIALRSVFGRTVPPNEALQKASDEITSTLQSPESTPTATTIP